MKIQVLIATPFGRGGQGGIDRLVDAVVDTIARRQPQDFAVASAATRGGRGLVAAQFCFLGFLAREAWLSATGGLDLVHINLASRGSTVRKLLVFRLARLFRKKTIVHLHGPDFHDFWQNAHPMVSRLIDDMFRTADLTIVLGQVWRDLVTSRVPEAAGRIVILPNAAPVPQLPSRRDHDGVRILFLGQLGARKGVPQLIDALRAMAELPGWSAVLAGDGEVDQTRARVKELGLDARVKVRGWAGPDAVAELLATSDILALPSRDENLPMSVIEAMAAGLAVVATPVGAVGDIITDDVTGLLVPPGDAVSLEIALRRLIGDRGLRLRLGKAACGFHREHLELEGYVDRLLDLWRGVAGPSQRI